MQEVLKQCKTALLLLLLMSLLTGVIYPTVVTGLAQVLFHWQANGSLINQNGNIIGSTHIGQAFTSDNYFWSRPSATIPFPYNAANSAGSNLGPTNPVLFTLVQNRITALRAATNSDDKALVPIDLVTASASGLDPDISPLAAFYQVPRIAQARQLPAEQISALIQKNIQDRTLGILGEPRVNVLQLNIALDNLTNVSQHNDGKAT
jgi:K+-transporting ATPase ATPase C chain